VWHTSGQWLEDEGLAMAAPNDPQKVGGAVTYARRYSLVTFMAITAADDDGQAATDHMRQPARQPAQQRPTEDVQPSSQDGFSQAAVQVFNSLKRHSGTPVAEHMKQWRADQGDNVPGFTLEALDADQQWLTMVADELANTLERSA
jgi:hypothetical protein